LAWTNPTEAGADRPAGALDGIKVVDLSRVLGGPLCGQILGDHGADVIKVEGPMGDETRGWGPPFVEGNAAYFNGANRNKRGLVLDLGAAEDREILLALLAEADVLIENFKAGTMEGWGLGYDILKTRFPKLVYCQVSGFGNVGPLSGLPGYDAVAQAMAGVMSVNGELGGAPTRVGIPIVDIATGMNAALGIALALVHRYRTGRGQRVDLALYDSAVALLHPHLTNYLAGGSPPVPTGNAHPNISPYDMFATATVPIFLSVGNQRQFERLARLIGVDQILEDARFASNALRLIHRSDLKSALETALASLAGEEVAERLLRAGVPAAAVIDIAALVEAPHFQARRLMVDMDGIRTAASPIVMSETPPTYRRRPPKLGEHGPEIRDIFAVRMGDKV
jgi:crotonobetainyl-CoA:carnitine CoA-transferase CaiB-like acyl-CoA transferase